MARVGAGRAAVSGECGQTDQGIGVQGDTTVAREGESWAGGHRD